MIDLPPLWTGLFLGFAAGAGVFGFLVIGAYQAGRDAERRSQHVTPGLEVERGRLRRAA